MMYRWNIITMVIAMVILVWTQSSLALSVTPLGVGIRPNDLAMELIDTSSSNLSISRIRYRGAYHAVGTFSDGMIDGLGIESGIILTTGKAANAIGPNSCYKTTFVNRRSGDSTLNTLGSGSTYDASVLEFYFVPEGDTLKFEYVFASDEYPEWVGSKFNDVFGFFLDGKNIALMSPNSTTPVAINTVNKWSYKKYYQDNEYPSPDNLADYNKKDCELVITTPFLTEYDGFTTVLTAVAEVTPGKQHHMKLAIADRGDFSLDSAVFIKGKSFTVVLPPPATTLVSLADSEITNNNTPTFTWQNVPNVTTYKFQVQDANGNTVMTYWYSPEKANCNDDTGTCSVIPSSVLPDGDYQWQVQTKNQAGNGPWSDTWSFTVKTLPEPAILVTPIDNILKCGHKPTYQWQAAELATWYFLKITDAQEQVLFEKSYSDAQANCAAEIDTCSVQPDFPLEEGLVKWQIQTANQSGKGPWSDVVSFTVKCPPTATTLIPNSEAPGIDFDNFIGIDFDNFIDFDFMQPGMPPISDDMLSSNEEPPTSEEAPTSYSWTAVPGATHYQLQIIDSQGQVVSSKWYSADSTNCQQGICLVDFDPNLLDGDYQWQVQTHNEVGYGAWSDAISFTVKTLPDAATLVSPTQTLLNCNNTPTYTWKAANLATRYLLWVQDSSGTTERWYDSTEANCIGGTCSITPDFKAAEGNVQWRIKTANQQGEGPWSETLSFTVQCPPPATTLISPQGVISDNKPTYIWNAVANATDYHLQVFDLDNQIVVDQTISDCDSESTKCSVTPNITLLDGDYHWQIQVHNQVDKGPWSQAMSFTVLTTPPAATLVSPHDEEPLHHNIPTYTWQMVPKATEYLIRVKDASGQVFEQSYTTEEANCVAETGLCSIKPDQELVEGQAQWWIQTANSSGSGPLSEVMPFTIEQVTTCKIYAVDDQELNDSQFFVVDPETMNISALRDLYMKYDIEGFDASLETGQLYAASGKDAQEAGVLYTVDNTTGEIANVGQLGLNDVSGLSFNPDTGMLWGWAPGDGLFWVNVNQSPLLPKIEWVSNWRIDDLTWNETGTVLYLAQKDRLLRYEGNQNKPTLLCTLPEGGKIEALEMIPNDRLLMGVDSQDFVYAIDVNNIEQCAFERLDIPEMPYQDVEGITWGCTRHYVFE